MLRKIGIPLITLAAMLLLISPPQASAAVRFSVYTGQPTYTYYPAYSYVYPSPYPNRYYYYTSPGPVYYYSDPAPIHVYSYTHVHRHHVKHHNRHVRYRY